MLFQGVQIGFALPANHFIRDKIDRQIARLVSHGATVHPLLLIEEGDEKKPLVSDAAAKLKSLTGIEPSHFHEDEPGTCKTSFDLLVVAPCPPSIVNRLVRARTTPQAKQNTLQHLQAGKPVILALIENGESQNLLANISQLLDMKNVFLVPLGPVRADNHKTILVTRMDLIFDTCLKALENCQLQPPFWEDQWLPH